MPPPRNRCGGFCGRAVRSAPAAARRLRRHSSAALLSLRTTPPAPAAAAVAGRLNKTRILSPSARLSSPQLRRRVARCRSLRAACGGTFKPPTAAELCRPRCGGGLTCSAAQSSVKSNRQGLRVAVQKARQQVHIIASRTYRCDSKAAEHGRYCTFACIAEQRRFSVHCAGLSAPQAVF